MPRETRMAAPVSFIRWLCREVPPRISHRRSRLHAFQDKQDRRLGFEFLRPLASYSCGEAEFERITLALIDATPVHPDCLVASPPDAPGIEGLRILRRINADETVYV